MSQNTLRVCPTCGQSNKTEKLICDFCGASLETATIIPADSQPDEAPPSGEAAPPAALAAPEAAAQAPAKGPAEAAPVVFAKQVVTLFVPGSEVPLKIRLEDGESVILGRMVEGETERLADLVPYNAQWLGVSRHHAMISRVKDQYLLKDMGSTNGTWLNDQRLSQLVPQVMNGGDQIRLSQMLLFIYMLEDEETGPAPPADAADSAGGLPEIAPTIKVSRGTDTARGLILIAERGPAADTSPKLPTLTPEYLTTVVGAYLSAIADAQAVIDQVLGRSGKSVGLTKFVIRSIQPTIRVGLTDAEETLLFLRDKVRPWRRVHAELIQQYQAELAKVSEKASLDDSLSQQMREAQESLAAEFIQAAAPTLTAEDQDAGRNKLLPYLDHLAAGVLEMVLDRRE